MLSRRQFLKLGFALSASALISQIPMQTVFGAALNGVTRSRLLAAQSPQIPLPGSAIPQFIDPLPDLLADESLISNDGTAPIELEMREHRTRILPDAAVPNYNGTAVWSYLKPGQLTRTSYLGPVVIAKRGAPTEMKFTNLLGNTADTKVLAYKYSTDQTLHWADPLNDGKNMAHHTAGIPMADMEGANNYSGSIPAAVHLHGGEVPPMLDGGPDAWFTSDGAHRGHGFYSKDGAATNYAIYRYPNTQEGALIWFHDHTLGATRLNVYAGLAGAYLLTDPADQTLGKLPQLVPLVIQDRMFDTNGELFFPAASAGGVLWATNPEHPYWVPEFLGDVIVVNGKSWPYMDVKPKRYTFMMINGSNARTYAMSLVDRVSKNPGPALWVVGTDGGYLDKPVKIDPRAAANNSLVMMSGERYWVVVDFSGYEAGKIGPNGLPYSGKWLLKNNAKSPYPAGAAPQGSTIGRIMEFRVAGAPEIDPSYNPASGAPLRSPMPRLTNAAVTKTRQLTLNEVMGMPKTVVDPVTGMMTAYPGGPLEVLVNNTKYNGERITGIDADGMFQMEPIPGFTLDGAKVNYLSEVPNEGETEIWEIVNLTADAHPIHLHLVQFQLLNRQAYDTPKYTKAYDKAFPAGYDYVMGAQTAGGAFIPAYGPPQNYNNNALNTRAVGGNPDVNPYLKGKAIPALPQENGWKDTVIMYPGQVTRILVRWGPTDKPANTPVAESGFPFNPNDGHSYVWHCHIVDHEDNEMMRPDEVNPIAGATRSLSLGVDY